MSIFSTRQAFAEALANLPAPDAASIAAAQARQAELTKPLGSLGKLEDLAVLMAGWQHSARPELKRARMVIFAGNHGFAVHGVSAFPVSVTQLMVANFEAGGAAINALSRAAGLELKIVPLDLDTPTADFTEQAAMTEAECLAALNAGAEAVTPNLQLLAIGEMGIGNTTAAAALGAHCYGGAAKDWVGVGTGIDAEGVARKTSVIDRALALHANAPKTAFETLRRLGGREIVAMAGAVLRARQLSIPVMVDGFISTSAIAPLACDNRAITAHCIAGHCSTEPGHIRVLTALGLDPLLHLGMRLGEGSGGAVAVNLLRSALAAHNEMASFAEAQIALD